MANQNSTPTTWQEMLQYYPGPQAIQGEGSPTGTQQAKTVDIPGIGTVQFDTDGQGNVFAKRGNSDGTVTTYGSGGSNDGPMAQKTAKPESNMQSMMGDIKGIAPVALAAVGGELLSGAGAGATGMGEGWSGVAAGADPTMAGGVASGVAGTGAAAGAGGGVADGVTGAAGAPVSGAAPSGVQGFVDSQGGSFSNAFQVPAGAAVSDVAAGTSGGSLIDNFMTSLNANPITTMLQAGSGIAGIVSGANSIINPGMSTSSLQAGADPWGASGGRAQSIAQLQALLANPSLTAGTPGYQFQFQQGENAVNAANAGKGTTGTGSGGAALVNYGQGQAMSAYNNYVNQLTTLAGANQNPAAGTSAALAGQSQNNAQTTAGYGALAKGVGTLSTAFNGTTSNPGNNTSTNPSPSVIDCAYANVPSNVTDISPM